MQTPGQGKFILQRAAILGAIALLLLPALPSADARTRRERKPNPIKVVLQPFLVARSVVHTVADPIVSHAPRVVVVLVTAPIKVARRGHEILHAEPVDEEKPVHVAYVVPRGRPAPPLDSEAEEEEEDPENQDAEIESVPERFGKGPTVAGSRAILRRGIACAPSRTPQRVKTAIWAANSLMRKPYTWGGGHGSFYDRGYDCSGTVSFALHGAGAIAAPIPSSDLMRYGERGRGRWITIYARRGHTFAVLAGLRLDTTDFQNGGNTGPRWQSNMRNTRGYVARHPAGM
ncbi:MAG: hypothetical protein M3429_07400 [Verrucomicrobiota bacterium]|nr:hypothetical protein [Verrucomicrobiota bacterium]